MPSAGHKKRLPNILLIGIDSLRADHMSCYGYHRQTTPHIGRFAQGGAVFEQTFRLAHWINGLICC